MNETIESCLVVALWTGVAGTLYAYAGFPILAAALVRRRKRTETSSSHAGTSVTVVIPAYNEERNIGERVRNILASDYPRTHMDIIVVSDASTDRTDAIAAGFESEGVRLIVQETRRGKTAGLNRAVELARGEVVVFTDANAVYQAGTIGMLLRHFQSPAVGLVSGYTDYVRNAAGEVARASNLHTRLERVIKRAESAWGCCMGADGAVFAMRKSLYRPLKDDDINDFVLPLSVLEQGSQCILDEDAVCSENAGASLESEFRRQSRITNRTLRALKRKAGLLNPFRHPRFAFFLFSHKIVRFLVPMFLGMSALSLVLLIPTGAPYAVAGALVVVALLPTMVANLWPRRASELPRPVQVCSVFVVVNLAMLHGWAKFLSGRSDVVWQHDRSNA